MYAPIFSSQCIDTRAAHAAQRDRALPAHAPRPQDVLPDAPRAKNAARIGARERQHHEPPYTHTATKTRGARQTRAESAAHTLPTHYERDAVAGARGADGTHPIQI